MLIEFQITCRPVAWIFLWDGGEGGGVAYPKNPDQITNVGTIGYASAEGF